MKEIWFSLSLALREAIAFLLTLFVVIPGCIMVLVLLYQPLSGGK